MTRGKLRRLGPPVQWPGRSGATGRAPLRTTIHPAPPLTVRELRRLRAGRGRLAEDYPDLGSAMRWSPDRITLLLPDGPHDCEATARVAATLIAALIGRALDYRATCKHDSPAPP